jgi:hypothetical protein
MVDRKVFKKKRPKMEKRNQRDAKGMPRKQCKWQYLDSEPGKRGPLTASSWKGLATHYAPPATHIYPSTTYCRNAKKLRTRMNMKKEQREKSIENIIDYAKEI